MFANQEEEKRALNELDASIKVFNIKYRVTADVSVFEKVSDKKSANTAYVDAFENLLNQLIQSEAPDRKINVATMRAAFEREVVTPYRRYAVQKANEEDVERVKRTLPDIEGGLNSDKWRREIDKNLDKKRWEKIDPVVENYKKRMPRIRDMVSETKRILNAGGDISRDDVLTVASYAAALRRANESRRGIWNIIFFVRSNAEQREAANIERMLNTRLGNNAYQNALKELTDPSGIIEVLKGQTKASQGIKLDFSVATNEKSKSKETEKRKAPEKREEKVEISVEDVNNAPNPVKEEQVPGNEQLYRLSGDKRFEAKIKDDIWKILKLRESVSLSKETVTEQIYRPLLANAKSVNADFYKLSDEGKDIEALNENLAESATTMFNEAYFVLKGLNLGAEDRVIAAQRIADTMLNNLTVIGFEKDRFGKYGDSHAVENETDVIELMQLEESNLSEETSRRLLRSAKKELSNGKKERIGVEAANDMQKGAPVSAKHEDQPNRNTSLIK